MKHVHHNRLTQLFVAIVTFFVVVNCLGCWSGSIKFGNLQHPVSMSAYLYGPHDEILTKDKELLMVKKFNYERTYWGTFGSFPLSSTNDIADNINKEIETSSGDGMVNFKVYVKHRAGLFWIVYRNIKVEGDIVKFGEMPPLSN